MPRHARQQVGCFRRDSRPLGQDEMQVARTVLASIHFCRVKHVRQHAATASCIAAVERFQERPPPCEGVARDVTSRVSSL